MSRTIVLTSAGIKVPVIAEALISRLPKSPEETTIAHIITASNVAPDTDYVKRDKDAMKALGFSITDVVLEGKTEKELYELLKNFDIVYVQGGNGFYLLRHIRASGFDKVVNRLLDEGKWYIGVSAGTYVCCPTIEMHNWKRVRENWYGLTDLSAMNLVPFLVTVHYNRDKYREKLTVHIPKASAPVRILTDEQAFFVRDGEVELVGKEPEIMVADVLKGVDGKQQWYITHSTSFDYVAALYEPLKDSGLWNRHAILLPHDEKSELTNSQEWIQQADVVLAEVSHASTGQGIELGWASKLDKRIVAFYKQGMKPSSSLTFVTHELFEYTGSIDLIQKLEKI